MSLMRGIRRWFVMTMMALVLTSCRIFVTPIISVSDLWDTDVRVVPVTISTDNNQCDKSLLDEAADLFQSFQNLQPVGCFDDNKDTLRPYWKTTIPLLRKGDEGKIPYLSASIYYSQNNSIIITFNPSFYEKLKRYTVKRGVNMTTDVTVTFQITNNTKKPVRIATQGVFVNNEAVGNEMSVFEVKPGGKIWIRLSDVGVNSLLGEGIEPVGVLPARTAP